MSLPDPPAVFGPEGGSPGVMLTWDLWCSRHLEPYRADWPRGAPLAMIRLFDAAVAMPAVAAAAHGETSQLTEALRRFRPLCCFISHEKLQAIYDETLPRSINKPLTSSQHTDGHPSDLRY